MFLFKRFAERKFKRIRRGERNRCWCGGELVLFEWHPSYGICKECSCYVNRLPPLPEDLKLLYSFDLYWHTRQQLKGFPSIEERAMNDRSDGRVDYWLRLIKRYGPQAGFVVEVGCAHGVLLAELKERRYECVGVEPDVRTAEWAKKNMALNIHPGFFPDIDLPNCDLFLAFDVIEHSKNPETFLKNAAELLNPGGTAIMQMPIDRYDYQPPFDHMFDKVFDDLEHLFIFNQESIDRLIDSSGLSLVAENRLSLAHEIIILRKNS
ncbi:MAG: class I SAM-dependent methyltransferase [Planctomycetota bacterium]|jgi:SAM-dependent methyltransferase